MALPPFPLIVTKWSALCGLAMVVIDVLITVWLGALNPGYSHVRQFISELGEAGRPFAWMFTVWSVAYGVLFAAFSFGLARSLGRHAGARPAAAALYAFAVGNVVGGVFACDSGCAGKTVSAQLHIMAGTMNLVAISLAPFFVGRAMKKNEAWRGYAAITVVVGCAIVALGVWLGLCYFVGLTPSWVGAVQRALMLVLYAWIAALAARLWGMQGSGPT
jgi:hypothetical membrane protein